MSRIGNTILKELDLYEHKTFNPITWFKRNSGYATLLVLILLVEIPLYVLKKILVLALKAPHDIYDYLDD